ncbi:MAG TPA: hypothetical protein VFN68_16535 [Acidimicrobiales bacterium]|nr:hypothetical protein [Acidimicrobiales bacterium]
MTAIAGSRAVAPGDVTPSALDRAEGVELLGPVSGSGYKEGAALVRRADGQMVQLGPLMYGLLESVDGERDSDGLAVALSERLGRRVGPEHVDRLAQKLAAQGLLAGSEHLAPPRSNPLLALRWKVLVTNPRLTRRLTAPFAFLFRPWIMWPVVAAFVAVFWFVLIHKGVASATSQAFRNPGLLLLVFLLAVVSAGFHELGHAAACRYGGATPGGMGMGLYLVWPAFYTDVTDAYRLPRRARLRVDLAGLYFNMVVAVLTMVVWLFVRADALLLLVALQILQMVKQLSPIIRADGYHILSDATGVPDLYAHMGPTLRRLLPSHRREPSALTGGARALVTVWVLVIVPVLLSLMAGAVLLLPKLIATSWDSGRHIAHALPAQAGHGDVLAVLASLLQLVALVLPALGSILVTQKVLRTSVAKGRSWSAGRPGRRVALTILAGLAAAGLAYAWWPSGQYQPVRANQGGTLTNFGHLLSAPGEAVRPAGAPSAQLTPGTRLAVAMIPVGGATRNHPALFVVPGANGSPATALLSFGGGTSGLVPVTSFPFQLPAAPGPHGTQAVALGTRDGGVTYNVAYSLITVSGGAPVDETNSAFALAHCHACTTVAVSFQVVLVIGQSNRIAPVNAAGSLNYQCPACLTTALADQMVVTLRSQPSRTLEQKLEADLRRLNALSQLGAAGTPTAVAAEVDAVQQQIADQLNRSGLVTSISSTPTTALSTTTTTTGGSSTSTTVAGSGYSSSGGGGGSSGSSGSGSYAPGSGTTPTSTASSSGSASPSSTAPPTTTGSVSPSTTVAPSSAGG